MPSPRSQLSALLLFALAATGAAGCGDDETPEGETTFRPNATITVAAPASLQPAFDRISSDSEELKMHAFYSGSDFHADKIREGELPDLLAADDPAIVEDLFDDGLV